MTAQQPNGRQAASSRWVRLGAIGAGVVAVVAISSWCAVLALTGDDDDSTPSGGDREQTATPAVSPTGTTTAAAQTQSPTAAATASPTGAATAAASPTAATATTAAQSPTQAATSTTAPATAAPTSAPAATATATATAAPTSTPTPTATPTTAPTATPTATPTVAPITNFAGTWHSAGTCPNPAAPYRWSVGLTQQGTQVSGYITFHNCPDGGRAEYSVSGTATSAQTIELAGNKTLFLGTLGGSTPEQVTFTIAPGGPPSPNYAP